MIVCAFFQTIGRDIRSVKEKYAKLERNVSFHNSRYGWEW